ncbi:MAG: response regulator, partial [Pirellulaceae bacterium]|nr:response regulator [Pirellulaceae bacterium]
MTEASERSHIIVIDDEAAPRESLRILLASKYDVDLADCVDEGIFQLNQRPADLIILDLRMPGKDGLDGLAEIREIDPNVSVVILTGFGTLEAARTAIQHGVTDFIEKPFDVNEMMRIVNDGLVRTEAHRRQSKADSVLRNMHDRFGGELDDRMHMAEIGQMSAELAHDLRNPLTIIQGYTQVLAKKLQQTDVPERYFDVIEQNVRRCNDLVELWQGLSSNLVRDSTQFDAAQLIAELVRDLEDVGDQVAFKLKL